MIVGVIGNCGVDLAAIRGGFDFDNGSWGIRVDGITHRIRAWYAKAAGNGDFHRLLIRQDRNAASDFVVGSHQTEPRRARRPPWAAVHKVVTPMRRPQPRKRAACGFANPRDSGAAASQAIPSCDRLCLLINGVCSDCKENNTKAKAGVGDSASNPSRCFSTFLKPPDGVSSRGSGMKLSRTMLAMAALTGLAGLSLHSAHAAPPPYSIVTGTGAAGQDQGTFSGTSGTIPELGLNWAVTATSPATQQYHVYNGVQTWTFTQGGSPAVVNLAFAISGVDAWTTDNSTNPASTVREAMGLPVGTVCNISNPAYVFPAGATDGTPGSPIFSWTPDNGAGMAVLRYLGGPGGPVNRYNQYPAVPCTYTGSQLVLTGAGFRGNEVGGTSFWHGLAYLRVLNSPSAAASPVPAMDILGLGAMTVLLGGVGSLVARRRRKQG